MLIDSILATNQLAIQDGATLGWPHFQRLAAVENGGTSMCCGNRE
jgi:hypothetical protein